MKLHLNGTMTPGQLEKHVARLASEALQLSGQNVDEIKLANVIVQFALEVEPGKPAVYAITEHDELLQIFIELDENGEIVEVKDNQDEPAHDPRLYSKEKQITHEEKFDFTKEVTSDYTPDQLHLEERNEVNAEIVQYLYTLKEDTDKLIIQYMNKKLNILVAEEVAERREK